MKIHCIGIGGIGVSSLAQYYLEKGHQVSGSDLAASEITKFLEGKGVTITIGQKAENITEDMDLVVYSPAVPSDNPELQQARNYKISTKTYPEALGKLTDEHYTIAISGSHGKSTTTSLIALILERAGLDPTVIVGTKLKEFGNSNFRMGKSKYLVIEACEYDSSFNHYTPQIAVVTNVDEEHLDYFKDFEGVKNAFKEFIARLPEGGYLVANQDDTDIPLPENTGVNLRPYSLEQEEAKKIQEIMQVPGQHNVSNALAALEVARILEVPDEVTFKALSLFQGTWRRFEVTEGMANGKTITVISDYAHHPSEISATLQAAREKYAGKTIWLLFQPHQHQRTHYLFEEFVTTFQEAPVDHAIITDIYDVAGREVKEINEGVNSQELVKRIERDTVQYFSLAEGEKHIKEHINEGDILIIMGAGDIYKAVENFK